MESEDLLWLLLLDAELLDAEDWVVLDLVTSLTLLRSLDCEDLVLLLLRSETLDGEKLVPVEWLLDSEL